MLVCELRKRSLREELAEVYIGTVFHRASSVSKCGLTAELYSASAHKIPSQ